MSDFGLKVIQIGAIQDCCKQYAAVDKVILYGSRAKGNFKLGSDIDLVIEGHGISDTDLLRLENRLDDLLLPYKIDLALLRQIDNVDLLLHIDQVDKVFYEQVTERHLIQN